MTYTDNGKRASYKYHNDHIKRVPLDLQKEFYEAVKAAAANNGMSVNGFIKAAIIAYMERLKQQ